MQLIFLEQIFKYNETQVADSRRFKLPRIKITLLSTESIVFSLYIKE